MPAKVPNPIDRHVGSRVRMRRLLVGMTQEKLGSLLGLTFQQVQKYEKGSNRIGASRLQQIADALKVRTSYFFDGAPGSSDRSAATTREPAFLSDFLTAPDGLLLAEAFVQIKDPKLRRRIVNLVQAIVARRKS
jgi:transcriptional regulator with XRE-family HTH domain